MERAMSMMFKLRTLRVLALAATSLAVSGCTSSEPTVPSPEWTARVHGIVMDVDGVRVPDATVRMRMLFVGAGAGSSSLGRCVGTLATPRTTIAAKNGSYSFDVSGTSIPLFSCIVVDADATVRGQHLAGSAGIDSLHIGAGFLDELQLLIRLHP
jgi:hypothetical protein